MHQPVALAEIEAAADRIAGDVVSTPLVELNAEGDIWLKLENLQPIGSFKLRGAANLIRSTDTAELAQGVWTASAGNMAQGVAWQARRLRIRCSVVVPDTAPAAKLEAIERLGAEIIPAPFDDWFDIFESRRFPGQKGLFLHAFSDSLVMAGNGTIGLEILNDLANVDNILVPWGGGGLSCGIASAVRATNPAVRIYACEFSEMAPMAASWEAGRRVEVPYAASFIDGIGGTRVNEEMFQLGLQVLDGVKTVPESEVAAAVRLMIERNHTVAEGAGAVAVAVALNEAEELGVTACIVSGGNIDASTLVTILEGGVP